MSREVQHGTTCVKPASLTRKVTFAISAGPWDSESAWISTLGTKLLARDRFSLPPSTTRLENF